MKFWQYLMGGLVALFIFAAALIADNMQFIERSTFVNNPFSLMGPARTSFGGEIQFLSSGELIWIDEDAELVLIENERRLTQGTVAIGGTFFSTSEDTDVTNKLWVGNAELRIESTSALVDFDAAAELVTILTSGGSIELWFQGKEVPFIIPAHSQITFNPTQAIELDSYLEYPELAKKFDLQPIFTGDFITQLDQIEVAFTDIRSQFGYFAWNLPILWAAQNGGFLRFLEKSALRLPAGKVASNEFRDLTEPIRIARKVIDEPTATKKLQEFKNTVLTKPLWQTVLEKNKQTQKEWRWFEFAQKIWLPVVSPDSVKQKFAVLWSDDTDSLRAKMRAIMLLSYNERWLRADAVLNQFSKQFSTTEFTAEDVVEIARFRREVSSLINTYPLYKNISFFTMWTNIVREEQKHLSLEQKEKISLEIAHEILKFVSEFLQKEDQVSLSKVLNKLWFELEISPEYVSFSPEEQTTIDLINLVGTTGMTPEQALRAQEQQEKQTMIEEQLKEIEKATEEVTKNLGISNAKKLWEFLAQENIELDITSFRTTRTETELTTRFANTETGKRKIEGVFDYNTQEFITLTLGEVSEVDLPAHQLQHWIKKIGGKFESKKGATEEIAEGNGVIQTTPQAILGKKFVQKKLRSVGMDVNISQLEMMDEEYQRCAISEASYQGAKINAEYNFITQEFSRISIQKSGQFISKIGFFSADELIQTIGKAVSAIPSKN